MAHALFHMLLVMILSNAYGCRDNAPDAARQAALPTTTMTIGSQSFTLEIADTDETRQRGLMHRQSMPRQHGMIFVFEQEAVLGFYMKSTHIPLDILFLDSKGKVLTIRRMQPLDLRTVSSVKPARYAIELNQGMAAEVGVKEGDVLTLPAAVTGAKASQDVR
jgi:uncharacterized protein